MMGNNRFEVDTVVDQTRVSNIKLVDNKKRKASTRSGIIEYVADGTDEAHVALS
jgi:hypothetical protein